MGDKSKYDGPRPGEIIAGKYEIQQVIGAGGMGVVCAARHTSLRQRVAIKFLRGKAHPELVARFMREARAAAALRSEHVVKVTDVDRLPGGEPFMVMEYLAGQNLSKIIRGYQPRPVPIPEAIDYMLQACDAIGEAHGLGIVHRDLKPGNLFVTPRQDGSPLLKVLDFGISKFTEEGVDEEMLTATNMILGSPQYASPEQLRNVKGADSRTDIWALGVILYYMLRGRRPFDAETVSALCLQIATETPPPIRNDRPEVPEALEALVMRCLVKDRNERLQSVQELLQGLRPFAAGAPAPAEAVPSLTAGDGQPQGPGSITGPGVSPRTGMGAVPSTAALVQASRPNGSGEVPSTSTPLPFSAVSVGQHAQGRVITLHNAVVENHELVHPGRGAAQSGSSSTAFKIAAALGVIALGVVAIMLLQSEEEPPAKFGDIAALSDHPAPTSTTSGAAAKPPTRAVQRGVAVSRSTAEVDDAGKPSKLDPNGPDAAKVRLGVGRSAVTRQTLTVTTEPGRGSVIGQVPAGMMVLVAQEKGEWRYISWSKLDRTLNGWVHENDLR